MKTEEIKKQIWKLLDGIENEYKIKYLILDIKLEAYKEGLQKGSDICKEVYQKK